MSEFEFLRENEEILPKEDSKDFSIEGKPNCKRGFSYLKHFGRQQL